MTDAECAETLAEFRKLTLGPELSAALDHAIGRMVAPQLIDGPEPARAWIAGGSAYIAPAMVA